jgi:tape measure domain-containing protein
MAEKVGALAYDLVMNTVRFERGMKKTRSSLRTLNQNFKKAAHPVQEYEQRMRDLNVALSEKQISPEQFAVFQEQELKALKKKGFILDKNGKYAKTEVKLLEEQVEEQQELNKLKRLQGRLRQEQSFAEKSEFVKRRNRGAEEHEKVMRRLHSRRLESAKGHRAVMLQLREQARLRLGSLGGRGAGRTAAIAGNFAGFMGASGAQIGGVRALATAGKGMLPLFAAGGMALGMKKAVVEADRLKRATIDIGVLMNNDSEGADKLVKSLQRMARKTPLATGQLTEAARQLMTFGRSAGKVKKDLEIIGTIAGGDAERFRLLTKAFGDVTAAGRLQGQELRQMTNQGFNPLMAMVEKTGKSYAELREEMEKGEISAKMVFEAAEGTSEKFAGRLAASMNTVGGQFSKLGGLISEIFSNIGEDTGLLWGVVEALKGINFALETSLDLWDKAQRGAEKTAQKVVFLYDQLQSGIFGNMGGLFDPGVQFRKFLRETSQTAQEVKDAKATEEILESKRIYQGDADFFKKIMEERKEVTKGFEEAQSATAQYRREMIGITEEQFELQRMKNDLADAEQRKHSTLASEIRKLIDSQKDLIGEQRKLSRAKRVAEMEQEWINETYDLEEKRIRDAAKLATDEVNKKFKLQQLIASRERIAGGPSDDFTAAGADYKFVQQRRNELNAIKIERQATRQRESQLAQIIENQDREHEANESWRERHPANQVIAMP